MLIVPTQAFARQELQVQLSGQNCSLTIAQNAYGLFMDVYVDGVLLIGGVICQNLNRIVRMAYTGFIGDLAFIDIEGTEDPVFTGLGSRFFLGYFTAADELARLG